MEKNSSGLSETARIFQENFRYMFDKLDTSYYHIKYDPLRYGDSAIGRASDVASPDLLPSYAVCAKIFKNGYLPKKDVINRIVEFYNENLSPATDSWQFCHELLEDVNESTHKKIFRLDKRFINLYYGFYISSRTDISISGAALKICQRDGVLHACLITGAHSDHELYNPKMAELLRNTPVTPTQFAAYLKTPEAAGSHLYYYSGPADISASGILLVLRSPDDGARKLVLTLDISKFPSHRRDYLGGMALALSSCDPPFDARVFQLGLINARCRPLLLSDERLPKLLKLRTNGSDLRIGKQDKRWYELARSLEPSSGSAPG